MTNWYLKVCDDGSLYLDNPSKRQGLNPKKVKGISGYLESSKIAKEFSENLVKGKFSDLTKKLNK